VVFVGIILVARFCSIKNLAIFVQMVLIADAEEHSRLTREHTYKTITTTSSKIAIKSRSKTRPHDLWHRRLKLLLWSGVHCGQDSATILSMNGPIIIFLGSCSCHSSIHRVLFSWNNGKYSVQQLGGKFLRTGLFRSRLPHLLD
jgi:hypothetical protein